MTTTRVEPSPARTPEQAIAALVPDGADYTHHDLIGAAITVAYAHPDNLTRGALWTDTDGNESLLDRGFVTVAEARRIIADALGPDGADQVTWLLAVHRTESLLLVEDGFVIQVLIVAKGGLGHAHSTAAYMLDVPFERQVEWVGSWDGQSLADCLDAGLSRDELLAVLDSGIRPDPHQVRTLAALRAPLHP